MGYGRISLLSACRGKWNGLHDIIRLCSPCHPWHSMRRSCDVKHVASYLNTRGCECFGPPPVQPCESHHPVHTIHVQLKIFLKVKVHLRMKRHVMHLLFTFLKFQHCLFVSVHLRSESSLTTQEWSQTASSIRWTLSVRLRWRRPSNSRRRSLWRRSWPSAVVLSRSW